EQPFEKGGRGALEGCRGGQAGSPGDGGVDERVESRNVVAAVLEPADHPANVVRPFRLTFLLKLGKVEDGDFVALRGGNAGVLGAIGAAGDDDVAVDGEGHHKAVAVVDVLADEVDPSRGGGGDGGGGLQAALEAGGGV